MPPGQGLPRRPRGGLAFRSVIHCRGLIRGDRFQSGDIREGTTWNKGDLKKRAAINCDDTQCEERLERQFQTWNRNGLHAADSTLAATRRS